ncbi:unnamed protein product [Adineta steineri]|uniref:Uncharacterized protein n=1 Tax=Adineta steineri TaxID=433720 RepID=A0A818L7J0_9BILA|nr:unnamed protein product [Adineta steineri]
MNNNRKSPIKQQQRMKNSYAIPVSNSNRMRSNSSMGSSYTKNSNTYYRHYSNTTSPTAMSACSLPAVPLFYATTYADPPECSSLPKPPDSWYITSNDENSPVETEVEDEKTTTVKQKSFRKTNYRNNNNNRGFYNPFCSSRTYEKFPTPYISVRA